MQKDYFDNFIKNIEIILKEKNWKKSDFALHLNCSTSTVSKWFNKKREPSFSYIVKITHILDCTFEELISYK